ncbi:integral membrane sensor signal transduction histidine kinase [Halothermothrix orenii H 168]|uniref:histidine kinase n=2 Tax=Halothermothrix orenii TaxID=31909 RepID=B8D203_HALOH|nr:integral membrane sensor signal transduction histidine kinase [Halothermothrix orenii H 168]
MTEKRFLAMTGLVLILALFLLDSNHVTRQIILILTVVIWLFFILKSRHEERIVDIVNEQLSDVLNGNLNRRILVDSKGKYSDFVVRVNELIDKLQDEAIKNKQYEASFKRVMSNISHDIRTPLTSILGYAEALKDGLAEDDEEREKYREIMVMKARRLKKLVDKLFFLARLEAGEEELDFKVYDLAEVTRECIIDFLPRINKEDLELKTEIPEQECLIYADHLALERMIDNLISNSINYGKEGGIIGVKLFRQEQKYVLQVWDKGPGITEDKLPHIFNRLYVGDKSVERQISGSGLGLAITRRLIEKHNGRITVDSKPYEKTIFSLHFPAI